MLPTRAKPLTVGTPEWETNREAILRHRIGTMVEVAYLAEKRAFYLVLRWVVAGVVSGGILGAGRFLQTPLFGMAELMVQILCSVALIVFFCSPIAFLWTLIRWLKAIAARRRIASTVYHPQQFLIGRAQPPPSGDSPQA